MTTFKSPQNPSELKEGDIITIKAQGRATKAWVLSNNPNIKKITLKYKAGTRGAGKRAYTRTRCFNYSDLEQVKPSKVSPITLLALGVGIASGGVAFTQYEGLLKLLQLVLETFKY